MSYLNLKSEIIFYTNKVEFYCDLCKSYDRDYFNYSKSLVNALNSRIETVSHLIINEHYYNVWVNTVYEFKKYSQKVIASLYPENSTFYLQNDDIFNVDNTFNEKIYDDLDDEWCTQLI